MSTALVPSESTRRPDTTMALLAPPDVSALTAEERIAVMREYRLKVTHEYPAAAPLLLEVRRRAAGDASVTALQAQVGRLLDQLETARDAADGDDAPEAAADGSEEYTPHKKGKKKKAVLAAAAARRRPRTCRNSINSSRPSLPPSAAACRRPPPHRRRRRRRSAPTRRPVAVGVAVGVVGLPSPDLGALAAAPRRHMGRRRRPRPRRRGRRAGAHAGRRAAPRCGGGGHRGGGGDGGAGRLRRRGASASAGASAADARADRARGARARGGGRLARSVGVAPAAARGAAGGGSAGRAHRAGWAAGGRGGDEARHEDPARPRVLAPRRQPAGEPRRRRRGQPEASVARRAPLSHHRRDRREYGEDCRQGGRGDGGEDAQAQGRRPGPLRQQGAVGRPRAQARPARAARRRVRHRRRLQVHRDHVWGAGRPRARRRALAVRPPPGDLAARRRARDGAGGARRAHGGRPRRSHVHLRWAWPRRARPLGGARRLPPPRPPPSEVGARRAAGRRAVRALLALGGALRRRPLHLWRRGPPGRRAGGRPRVDRRDDHRLAGLGRRRRRLGDTPGSGCSAT